MTQTMREVEVFLMVFLMNQDDALFQSFVFTAEHGFTSGIEGPATDGFGNIYAVNYAKQGTIGRVTPDGQCSIFVELPGDSVGNGIRFNRSGEMLIADYVNHNIFKVDMGSRELYVFAHESRMNQPNDICISKDDVMFASDPDWQASTGQIWRIGTDGDMTLMETDMGTTNGIEFSPDGTRLYVNESVQRRIYCYAVSSAYELSNKQLFAEFADYGLDGMRCDKAGNLYVTRYGKGTVAKFSAEGVLLREIELTGKNCTNITFGGADGKTCYVTVADKGNLEAFRVDIPG